MTLFLIFLIDFLDAEPLWCWNVVARWRVARGLARLMDEPTSRSEE